MISDKLFRVLIGLLGILGQAALGVCFSGLLVPRQLDIGAATSAQLV